MNMKFMLVLNELELLFLVFITILIFIFDNTD
uniref:Uncharacterized protein n=1 Tax=Arundo donax TaxID=35708 RepID=A0A0A8YJU1_ARUDO